MNTFGKFSNFKTNNMLNLKRFMGNRSQVFNVIVELGFAFLLLIALAMLLFL